jgi:hypothetical protein
MIIIADWNMEKLDNGKKVYVTYQITRKESKQGKKK